MASVSLVESLRQQVASCEAQLAALRLQLAEAEILQERQRARQDERHIGITDPAPPDHDMSDGIANDFRSEIYAALSQPEQPPPAKQWPLDRAEYKRYGRQLIMPEIGLQGQLRLKNASVLIVGVGGLGCPAAAYLVGAGVGTVGLVDGDIVEESNLHRQILHSTPRVGMTKVDSARVALSALNPNVKLVAHQSRLTPESALSIMQPYDVVLDCTDSPASRYLVSDSCVLLQKPLVSASALRTDGQLMVLNNPPLPAGDAHGGPCYRCIYPRPPPPELVVSCGDGGILGPVVGTMGVLQALEAVKLLTRDLQVPSGPTSPKHMPLLIFSAYSDTMFRSMRMRGSRKPKCAACSAQATVTPEALNSGSLDYVQFCGSVDPVHALRADERVSADSFSKIRTQVNPFTGSEYSKDNHILVDVREKVQFELCNLEGSVNIPFSAVSCTPAPNGNVTEDETAVEPDWVVRLRSQPDKPIFVVCRLGNDSQVTVKRMKEMGLDNGGQRWIGDIKGGLRAWRANVEPDFPDY